jgi:thioredoxin:protein disulfide reductase
MKKIFLLLFILFSYYNVSFSQETQHLKISAFNNKEIYPLNDTVNVAIKIAIKDKYHINSYRVDDPTLIKTELSSDSPDFKLIKTIFPPDSLYKFEFSESKIRVYKGSFIIGCSFTISKEIKDGEYKIPLKFRYQACDDKACYEPKNVDVELNIKISGSNFSKSTINGEVFKNIDFSKTTESQDISNQTLKENPKTEVVNQDEKKVANLIEEKGLFIALIVIFIWGLALNLTPCIYPLIPITISYFGAQASGNKFRSILMGVFYALGMSVTYSALGVVSALAGGMIGAALQNPFVVIFLALIFIALAASMFGFWEIRIPQKLALAGNKSRSGLFGSLIMGLLVGFIAAPCIGPVVLSLVVYVGDSASKFGNSFIAASYGFFLFFILSMGLGLPYVFLAAFSNSISKLPRSGEWMEGVKIIFGLILIGLALYTINPILPKGINEFTLPVFMILSGIYLVLINKKGNSSKAFYKIKNIIALGIIIYGTWTLKPETQHDVVAWKNLNTLQQIESSISSEKKLTMIDFSAEWCAQCKELDKYTYTDKEVVVSSKNFNNIKVDLTKEDEQISKKFNIKGLPVVIFMNSKGEELKELRVTGFLKPSEFITKIKLLQESENKK